MKDIFNISGKNAIVIGGAGGIGQAIAQGLAFYGANVSIASRSLESLQRAKKEIKEEINKEVSYYQVDVSNENSINNLVKDFIKDKKRIDILINSQGFNQKFSAVDFPMDVWDSMFAVNVKGVMMCCKIFGKLMKEQGSGKIINISSVRGVRGCGGGNSSYCSTKGAVDMMTKALSVELGPEVNVNAIGPAITETPMMIEIFKKNPDLKIKTAESVPLKRIGKVEDCIGAAVYLASDASSFVTGQIIYPDGGLTAIG